MNSVNGIKGSVVKERSLRRKRKRDGEKGRERKREIVRERER